MPPLRKPDKQRLDKALDLLEGKHGPRVVQVGKQFAEANPVIPPHIGTGFAQLDGITGCKGIPLGHLTLLTGKTTSGKLTLAYRILAQAQGKHARSRDLVAILDLVGTSDADYIHRVGLDLESTVFVRQPQPERISQLIYDLLRKDKLRALLVDGLPNLLRTHQIATQFDAALPHIQTALRSSRCALIALDEPQAPWLRWLRIPSSAVMQAAGLHLDLAREAWSTSDVGDIGFRARAQLIRSRWANAGAHCEIGIRFRAFTGEAPAFD